jgi:hypothetical protein
MSSQGLPPLLKLLRALAQCTVTVIASEAKQSGATTFGSELRRRFAARNDVARL